jgi:hypothetical protein
VTGEKQMEDNQLNDDLLEAALLEPMPRAPGRPAGSKNKSTSRTEIRKRVALHRQRKREAAELEEEKSAEYENLLKRQRDDAKTWLMYITEHRDVAPILANQAAILEIFAGEPLSISGIDEVLANPQFRSRFSFLSPQEDRTQVLQKMKTLTGELSPTVVYQSTEEIRSKVEALQRKKEMESKSPEELRKIIRDGSKPAPAPDDLPANMTRQYLLDLKGPEFRKIVDRFGSVAVTNRLNRR